MKLFGLSFFPLLVASCAGAAPTPSATPSEPEPTAKPRAAAVETDPEAPKSAEPSESAPEPAAAPSAQPAAEPAASSEISKKPSEILGGPMVAFIVDYQGSTPYETAEKTCEAESKGDASARADCMQKARGEFRADVLHFKKEQGRWWLTVYERKGSNLPEVYKTQFDFSDEKKDRVTLKIKDTGKQGTRPFFAGQNQITVVVPDDYSIRLEDPKLGRLVYNAKVGLVGK